MTALNYFQTAFYTGLRPSELAGLKWANVDFIGNTIKIDEALVSVGDHAHKQTTKTNAGARIIELAPKAVEALKHQQKLTRFSKGHVFTRYTKSPLIRPEKRYWHTSHQLSVSKKKQPNLSLMIWLTRGSYVKKQLLQLKL